MNLGLRLLEKRDLPQYKADMQGAFQLGAQEGGCFAAGELVLPESDIDRSLGAEGTIAYRAVEGGQIVGGAIVVWDREKKLGHLDLLYVKHGTGCITEINDHLFEGRYSPMWIDGKMKAELAELKKQKAKIGSQPQAREGKKRKKPEQTKKASKRLISRCADNFAHQEMSFLE